MICEKGFGLFGKKLTWVLLDSENGERGGALAMMICSRFDYGKSHEN